MSADFENLKAFFIAITRAQLATDTALSLMSLKLRLMEAEIAKTGNSTEQNLKQLSEYQQSVDDAIGNVRASTDAMLDSLEKYANG